MGRFRANRRGERRGTNVLPRCDANFSTGFVVTVHASRKWLRDPLKNIAKT